MVRRVWKADGVDDGIDASCGCAGIAQLREIGRKDFSMRFAAEGALELLF